MNCKKLKTEYAAEAAGIDCPNPRFSWALESNKQDKRQTAYHITLSKKDTILWDTGKVESNETFGIPYAGEALEPDQKYVWRLQAWDEDGAASPEAETFFTTGKMGEPWKAEWITRHGGDGDITGSTSRLRKDFTVDTKPERATVFIFAKGFYELYVNGKKADDRLFAPYHPASGIEPGALFSKEQPRMGCLYDVYDITGLLHDGDNRLGIWLGNGYLKNHSSRYYIQYEEPRRAIAEIRLHQGGDVQVIGTDTTWQHSNHSPIVSNGIFDGEHYDAWLEMPLWASPGWEGTAAWGIHGWHRARVIEDAKDKFFRFPVPDIRITEELKAVKRYDVAQGVYVFDFGQNIAGFVRIRAKGNPGVTITLRYAEEIFHNASPEDYPDTAPYGEIDNWTYRDALATDRYTLRGSGVEEIYTPRFTYHGFRYVEVSGYPLDSVHPDGPGLDVITACVVHADYGTAGSFRSDDPLLNRIYQNMRWSIRGNSISFPTDCPSRCERTPCTMDLYAYEDVYFYLFDAHSYLSNWLAAKAGEAGQPDWHGEQISMAWNLYYHYGDLEPAARHYDVMRNYVFTTKAAFKDNLYNGKNFGDWCAPNEEKRYGEKKYKGYTEFCTSCVPQVNTALFCMQLEMFAELAEKLGKNNDAAEYRTIRKDCAEAYHKTFYDPQTQRYGDDQVPTALALRANIVPENLRKTVAASFVCLIREKYKGHLWAGIYGAKYIPEALFDAGEADLVLEMLEQKTFPGYGHQIEMGATTVWEQWHYQSGMDTHNHAMFSGPAASFFSRLAGLSSIGNGFDYALIKPLVPRSLNEVECSYEGVRGTFMVHWKKEGGVFTLKIKIPPNCRARVELPDGQTNETASGEFIFNVNYNIPAKKEINE